ncbi:hydrogenase expression protein HupH [Corynebacterium sp. 13CS0277]|uniref:hydrogenase maturation nickel metallochaperone HypA/HybF n=1 Tax=Corynebacterium sp. 13CS0277 TaxID=2071994 RepID=UPI000D027E40|nr:hydrogenase maturation nickel metallochaperone HypA [Corynebacterium sp. 13CS0277]PRQ10973.1 hydrogenase expression protein HupH [Corynebacterium sp. 13CS0277]
MHEYGLAVGVVAAVTAQVPGRRIRAVGVKVGARSGVEPFALESSWPLATEGTAAEGSRLDIERVPATVACSSCDSVTEIDEFFDYTCPQCGEIVMDVRSGAEFQIAYADVDDGEGDE